MSNPPGSPKRLMKKTGGRQRPRESEPHSQQQNEIKRIKLMKGSPSIVDRAVFNISVSKT